MTANHKLNPDEAVRLAQFTGALADLQHLSSRITLEGYDKVNPANELTNRQYMYDRLANFLITLGLLESFKDLDREILQNVLDQKAEILKKSVDADKAKAAEFKRPHLTLVRN